MKPLKQTVSELSEKVVIILKGVLLLTVCSSYFLYLCTMFYAGTLGDAPCACFGFQETYLEVEGIAFKHLRIMLSGTIVLLFFWSRSHFINRIFFILTIISILTIILLILGAIFSENGESYAF